MRAILRVIWECEPTVLLLWALWMTVIAVLLFTS
jgi:hypothetical protein